MISGGRSRRDSLCRVPARRLYVIILRCGGRPCANGYVRPPASVARKSADKRGADQANSAGQHLSGRSDGELLLFREWLDSYTHRHSLQMAGAPPPWPACQCDEAHFRQQGWQALRCTVAGVTNALVIVSIFLCHVCTGSIPTGARVNRVEQSRSTTSADKQAHRTAWASPTCFLHAAKGVSGSSWGRLPGAGVQVSPLTCCPSMRRQGRPPAILPPMSRQAGLSRPQQTVPVSLWDLSERQPAKSRLLLGRYWLRRWFRLPVSPVPRAFPVPISLARPALSALSLPMLSAPFRIARAWLWWGPWPWWGPWRGLSGR